MTQEEKVVSSLVNSGTSKENNNFHGMDAEFCAELDSGNVFLEKRKVGKSIL